MLYPAGVLICGRARATFPKSCGLAVSIATGGQLVASSATGMSICKVLFWAAPASFGGHIVRQPTNCTVAFTAAGRGLAYSGPYRQKIWRNGALHAASSEAAKNNIHALPGPDAITSAGSSAVVVFAELAERLTLLPDQCSR